MLLDALNILRKNIKNFKFIFIGRGGKHFEELKQRVTELNLWDHIIFPGYHNERYVDLLNLLDVKIFLVPGYDGSCRAVMEAMSMAKPVISSKRGILPELVTDKYNGFVCDENADVFAEYMLKLYKNRNLSAYMGQKSREKILSEHTLDNQFKQILKIYEDLMRGK